MKLQHLQDLIAVAECGSLRAAARARGVTAPALAKNLRALEEELQVPLLERKAKGVSLTHYGQAVLIRARLIDKQRQQAIADIAQLRGSLEGSVTIGVGPTPATALMPSVLGEFQRRFPHVRIALVSGMYDDHVRQLRSGQLDLAVVAVPNHAQAPGLRRDHLFFNDPVVACRRGHPMSHARHLAELADCEWMTTGPANAVLGSAVLEGFARLGIPAPSRVIQCDMGWALQSLLIQSDRVCILPRVLLQQPVLSQVLQPLAIEEQLPRYAICLIQRKDEPLPPMAQQMATLVRRHAHYLDSGALAPDGSAALA